MPKFLEEKLRSRGAGSSGGAQTPEIVASPTLKAITPALTAATLT